MLFFFGIWRILLKKSIWKFLFSSFQQNRKRVLIISYSDSIWEYYKFKSTCTPVLLLLFVLQSIKTTLKTAFSWNEKLQ